MEFFEDGDYTISKWQPEEKFNGYKNILHGGIQATIADEIGSWFVTTRYGRACVTSKLETRYHKPIFSDKGEITIKASLKEVRRNIIFVIIEIFDIDNILCTEAIASYFTFSDEISKKEYFFPGVEKFFE
jgi:uncharacterized protein (TIGR00369 family)